MERGSDAGHLARDTKFLARKELRDSGRGWYAMEVAEGDRDLEGGMVWMGGLRWRCGAGGGRFLKAEHIGPRCSLLTDNLQHKNNQSRKDRQGRGGWVGTV